VNKKAFTAELKQKAREFGADLIGIALCETLEKFPPDPNCPQVPSRISQSAKSCVVIAKRTPWGEFLSSNATCVSLTNQLVLRRLEKVSLQICYWMEERGHYTFMIANDETDPDLKRGSYGSLSHRHLAVEAGLGTLGLEVNLLTREFGPRVYFSAMLTDAELEPDARITEQLCIGEPCSRCLLACPTDPPAVLHWGLDKRQCAKAAQRNGVASIIYGPLLGLLAASSDEELRRVFEQPNTHEQWLAVTRLSNSFAACPRCVEVCPVGDDYLRHLAAFQKQIPEENEEKLNLVQLMREASNRGEQVQGSRPIDIRWVGDAGYKGKRKAPLHSFNGEN
jgi:ferredoxin